MDIITLLVQLVLSGLDIFLVSAFIYLLFKIVLKSQNHTLIINGIITFILLYFVSKILNLQATNAILGNIFSWGIVIIFILFQTEIKEALVKIGSFSNFFQTKTSKISFLEELRDVCFQMAEKKTGALIAIVREQPFDTYTKKAVEINADFSSYLVSALFNKEGTLHDGAIVIENDKITHASTYFPISLDINLDKQYGTRHRAALTVSKENDCIVIIVSEETGNISFAYNGNLITKVEKEFFVEFLREKLEGE